MIISSTSLVNTGLMMLMHSDHTRTGVIQNKCHIIPTVSQPRMQPPRRIQKILVWLLVVASLASKNRKVPNRKYTIKHTWIQQTMHRQMDASVSLTTQSLRCSGKASTHLSSQMKILIILASRLNFTPSTCLRQNKKINKLRSNSKYRIT